MKMNRDNIHLEHYRGNEEFVKRMYDLMDQAELRNRIVITPFFSPDQRILCERLCGHLMKLVISGGYDGAERVRVALLPFEEDVVFPISTLHATYSTTYGSLSHRDVLGALMNVGIQREKMGDIILEDGEIFILVDEEIEHYIICNLTKIKRTSVHFVKTDRTPVRKDKKTYVHHIVSSLRLDVVVASLAHVSRSKSQDMIVAGRVKVDHVVLEQTSYMCNNNSAISIRGIGRFHFAEVLKRTKKDHYVIDVGVYE